MLDRVVPEVTLQNILIMKTEVLEQEPLVLHKVHHILTHLLGDQTAELPEKDQAEGAEFLMEVAVHLLAEVEAAALDTPETLPRKAVVL